MLRFTLCVVLLWAAVPAAAEYLECDIRERGIRYGYVPDRLLVQPLDDGSGVLVQDALTQRMQPGPVLARVLRRDDELLQITWRVTGLYSRTSQYVPSMLYRFSLWRSSGKMRMTVHPAGFDVFFRGDGRCSRRE